MSKLFFQQIPPCTLALPLLLAGAIAAESPILPTVHADPAAEQVDDAAKDADGDGLTDAQEKRLGLDPTDHDTDDDGVSDGDEVNAYKTDPLVFDVDGDGDGLTNDDEVNRYGTSPVLADSDSDGTNDLRVLHSKAGTDTSYRNGSWDDKGDVACGTSTRHMRLEYDFSVDTADMCLLSVSVTNCSARAANEVDFSLHILIDGTPVDWLEANVRPGETAAAVMTTPWLSATTHTIRLAWLDEHQPGKMLGVTRVRLLAIDGADTNSNGRQDWVEAALGEGLDTDGDGLADVSEIDTHGTDVLAQDTDGDTLGDGEELSIFRTNPLSVDSDGDGNPDARLVGEKSGADTSYRDLWYWWYDQVMSHSWIQNGNELVRMDPGIWCAYDIEATNAGMHRIGLTLRNHRDDPPDDHRFRVEMKVNDVPSGEFDIFADVDRSGTGYLTTPWMSGGPHSFGLRWINDDAAAGRDANLAIQTVSFYEIDGADADSNGVQDWMEARIEGLGSLDSDKDGIADYEEVHTYASDPTTADSDNDGLADGVEVRRHGTDPADGDSDGDGVNDGEELRETRTDPLQGEFGERSDIAMIPGAAAKPVFGDWEPSGTEIVAKRRRGAVEYEFECATSDIYRIQIEATHSALQNRYSPLVAAVDRSHLEVSIDGRFVGRRLLVAPDGRYGTVRLFTPLLPPGKHKVKIYWENVHRRIALKIKEIVVQRFAGVDVNTNGVSDWIETSAGAMATIDKVHGFAGPGSSVVSPVCIEGRARYPDLMKAAVNSKDVAVNPGTLERWYINADLAPAGPTRIDVSFQNGLVTRTTNIQWVALNILEASDIKVRAGDAMKLTGRMGGREGKTSIEITRDGRRRAKMRATPGKPAIYTFDRSGEYSLVGHYRGGLKTMVNTVKVTVVEAAFPADPPACLIGKTRTWNCPEVGPDHVALDGDGSVEASFSTNGLVNLRMWNMGKPRRLLARLGKDGPVLDSIPLKGFWMQAAVDSYMWVVERRADSAIWLNELIVKGLPDDVEIKAHIIAAGVTFEDRSIEMTIGKRDLDELGEYGIRMIRPDSVKISACHSIWAYQDGVTIGEAYYSGVLAPGE